MTTTDRFTWLRAGLGLGALLLVAGAGCWSEPKPVVTNSNVEPPTTTNQTEFVSENITKVTGDINTTLTATQLATAMVNEVDVLGQLFAVRPEPIQFNDQLDVAIADDSEFFLARHWWDEVSGNSAFETAVTKYYSPAVAVTSIAELASDRTAVTPTVELGDITAVYYQPATADSAATLTYRFAVGQYGVRLTLFSTTDPEADVATVTDDLLSQLQAVAITQHNKLVDVITSLAVAEPSNVAIAHLPTVVDGATELGTTTVNFMEWYGITYDLESDDFPGFTSGGLRRWRLDARPDEVLEVTVMELASAEQATTFVTDLIPSLPDATEIVLPDTIADQADAVNNNGLFELQAASGRFVIDTIIFSPFGEIDETAAEADLIDLSEKIITDFVE